MFLPYKLSGSCVLLTCCCKQGVK